MNEQRAADAARARRDQTAQRTHRPRERASRAVFRSQIRAESTGSDTVRFEGLASAYERSYEMYDIFGPYTEIVSAGAASQTLARARAPTRPDAEDRSDNQRDAASEREL